MKILPRIESFLRDAVGLNSGAIAVAGVTGAVRERMTACGVTDEYRYLELLLASPFEQQRFIGRIVVPETWFFRDDKPFQALRDHVLGNSLPSAAKTPLRLLSVPCSTGEEPYSMAMVLSGIGLNSSEWRIDACDISAQALSKARMARYGRNSFRGGDLAFRACYFHPEGNDYVLDESVRQGVNFEQGNIIDPRFAEGRACYEIIFFRNLLIYLGDAAQERALSTVDRLLSPTGLLVVGHAEACSVLGRWFSPVSYPGAFAYRKRRSQPATPPHRPSPAIRKPRLAAVGGRTELAAFDARRPAAPDARASAPQGGGTAEQMIDQARRLADQGRLDQAFRLCDSLPSEFQRRPAVYYLLGLIWDARGDAARAEACFRKTLYLEPEHHEALTHLALVAEREGDQAASRRFRARAAQAEARSRDVNS